MSVEEKLDVGKMENMGEIAHLLGENKNLLPKKVDMLELLLRDGFQHAPRYIPVYTKVWFADQIAKAGYKKMEVTNFGHPTLLPQTSDAEEVMELVYNLPSVRENNVHLKVYGMTIPAFQRVAECCQKGFGPDSVAFTISTEDLHGRRNSGRCRAEYWKEIPEMVRIAKENNFDIDMAIACVYGSPCAGPVPIQNTFDLIDRGLDLGIRHFTPCDTTGESNPLRTYLYMAALVDRYGKYDDEITFRIAHFHEARGMSIANYVAAILGGARIIEASLGGVGGQPAYIVDGEPGHGSGPLYTNSWEVGNGSSEDLLVCLDEMGIQTGVDIDKMLQIGRVLEWVMGRTLPVWTTKAGRPIKQPVEWAIAPHDLAYTPPFGPPQIYWADPSRYKPATMEFIQKQFEGRPLAMDPWEEKVKSVAEQEKGKTAIYSHGGPKFGNEEYKYTRASDKAPRRWFLLPKKKKDSKKK